MNSSVEVRSFPYPFSAGLAICSDIDNSTFDGFLKIHRFLNTDQITEFGEGLNLEIGDSFWMYSVHPSIDDAFTYFDGTSFSPTRYAETMRELIRAGYLDTIHTWGNFSERGGFSRSYAEVACEELDKYGLHPPVWVNHDDGLWNTQRLGGPGQGHVKGTSSYHADLTFELGIRYVWENLLTTVVGQSRPLHLRDDLNLSSLQSLLFRPALYWWRGAVDQPWLGNDLISQRPLFPHIDKRVRSFTRYGWWFQATGDDLPLLLANDTLERLCKNNGAMIVYVHTGQQFPESRYPLSEESVMALFRLAEFARFGRIFVTTTSRLLRYIQVRDSLRWRYSDDEHGITIHIDAVRYKNDDLLPVDEETCMGLTFYTPKPDKTTVIGPKGKLPTIVNLVDESGRTTVSIPWKPLRWPL